MLSEIHTDVSAELLGRSDPATAAEMAAYMRDRFDFLGVRSPERRQVARPLIRAAKAASPDELVDVATAAWLEEPRELQYVGVDVLRAGADRLRADDLTVVRKLITTKSWWDTVDLLAAWVVGPIVTNHPQHGATMDRWIDDANLWLVRAALLHQLGYKEHTDADRLFAYAARRAEHRDFFVRKAIGWALRQYARHDPDAVRSFAAANEHRLSDLTRREALKHIGSG